MVIEDIGHRHPSRNKIVNVRPAHVDRIFAAVIDFLILSPLIALLTAGITADLKWQTLLSQSHDIYFLLFQYYYISFSIFVLYESLFNYFLKATPGHFFLYQRIKPDVGEEPLSFIQLFFRAVFKFISITLFGLPFIEILIRDDRKAFYDRIALTHLISLKEKSLDEVQYEMKVWLRNWSKSFVLIFYVAMTGLFFQMTEELASLERPTNYSGVNHSHLKTCQGDLNVYLVSYLSSEDKERHKECILQKTDFNFDHKDKSRDSAMDYLARYIINTDEVYRDKYLQKFCVIQPDSLPCQKVPDLSRHQLAEKELVYYLYFLNKFVKSESPELIFVVLDQIYPYVKWNSGLQSLYFKSYLQLETTSSRRPAQVGVLGDPELNQRKKRFKERMGLKP